MYEDKGINGLIKNEKDVMNEISSVNCVYNCVFSALCGIVTGSPKMTELAIYVCPSTGRKDDQTLVH